MSEGSAGVTLMDAKQFIYLPKWVKASMLAASALLLALAAVSVYQAVVSHVHSEALVFFVSVAQSATLILVFFLVVTFSRRDANVNQLHVLTDEFFKRYIVEALAKVSIPALSLQRFSVTDEGVKDIFGRLLHMTSGDYQFRLWVGLNVRRLFVIYFVPLSDGDELAHLEQRFAFTFGGAEKVGYTCNFEEAVVDGQRLASIWLTADTENDLLSSPQDKLFWAQDIAMMTESFLRTAHRHSVNLKLDKVSPGPL